MGEKAQLSGYERLVTDSDAGLGGGGERDEGRVLDWEDGLPSGEDLSPLSLLLVPPELASAFSIPPADLKTIQDVNRASQQTVLNIRHKRSLPSLDDVLEPFAAADDEDPEVFTYSEISHKEHGADDSSAIIENAMEDQRALKRSRLVWTPQLHKRFVDVVAHLGIKNVVPKTIMQLMNVEGLTRENVASHLQKYRLYLKRMEGHSYEGPSTSDHLFASTTVPLNIHEQQEQQTNSKHVPVQHTIPAMIPMPIYSIPRRYSHEMYPFHNHQGSTSLHDFAAHLPYKPNNLSSPGKFGAIISYPHVHHNDK